MPVVHCCLFPSPYPCHQIKHLCGCEGISTAGAACPSSQLPGSVLPWDTQIFRLTPCNSLLLVVGVAAPCTEEWGCWTCLWVPCQGCKAVCCCLVGCWVFVPFFCSQFKGLTITNTELKECTWLFPSKNSVALLSCHVLVKGGNTGLCGRPSE